MRYTKILLLISMLMLTVSCSSTGSDSTDPSEVYKNYSAEQLYVEGKKAVDSRNYENAKQYYEALDSLYPFNKYSQRGQLDLTYAYYKSGDYISAEASADRFIRFYPRAKHTDYAYYLKGLSLLKQGKTFFQRHVRIDMALRDNNSSRQAFYAFQNLVKFFPRSQYTPLAKKHISDLLAMFADRELDISKYYFKRRAYVGAVNRANALIKDYPDTPQVQGALEILVKANRKMGLNDAADDALKMLESKFSG